MTSTVSVHGRMQGEAHASAPSTHMGYPSFGAAWGILGQYKRDPKDIQSKYRCRVLVRTQRHSIFISDRSLIILRTAKSQVVRTPKIDTHRRHVIKRHNARSSPISPGWFPSFPSASVSHPGALPLIVHNKVHRPLCRRIVTCKSSWPGLARLYRPSPT